MSVEAERSPGTRYIIFVLPLAIFGLLLLLLMFGLGSFSKEGRDPKLLTWVLQGKPVPTFSLPALPGLTGADGKPVPGLKREDLLGHITILNYWGSWCPECRDEQPMLMRLARLAKARNVRFVSINYKDQPAEKAVGFLRAYGNPFEAIGVDASGRTAIDFGVYGAPETFIIGPDAIFAEKLVGPLYDGNWDDFMAKLETVIKKFPNAVANAQ